MEEKEALIEGLRINYKVAGKGEPVLILHGWGKGSDAWEKVIKILANNFLVICPDFPGFGKSQSPPQSWDLTNFVIWLKNFVEKLNLKSFFLLAHSFGGRIAIKFSISYPEKVKKLVLCASAGIKKSFGLKERIISWLVFLGNFIFSFKILKNQKEKVKNLFYRFLNRDYFKANEVMRETMRKILAEDLFLELQKIRVKTLIVWGKKDRILPIKYAFLFKEKIKDSSLEILSRVGHSPHLEAPEKLARVVFNFFIQKNGV